ncbi:hypothetical protein DACRYDRAFT_18212 [Dacryopinax primogenitus]|uniref:Uncharacterized protein n=1 Tax=Dacryopinax primogenitus (strain DJM 731) TaxID=1858805 RepID=M5FSG3_DACPD|nr:uncharacterized protein DACRYDRAFT_18212 [Dacryopinax primogenitus]EJT98119.1 hypothetical protein DACRYDRAFT_18212 [Dacryopinax primogenitus]
MTAFGPTTSRRDLPQVGGGILGPRNALETPAHNKNPRFLRVPHALEHDPQHSLTALMKYRMKNASPQRQEQARLEVENAEDDLVQQTEVAITLRKTLLDNPEPLKNLNELVKAQLVFHSTAAEALQGIQGDIEELTVAAEGKYRKSRDH